MNNSSARAMLIAELVRGVLYFCCQDPWLLDEPCLDPAVAVLPANAALVVAAERQSLLPDGTIDVEEFLARCPSFFAATASKYIGAGRNLLKLREAWGTTEEHRREIMVLVSDVAESIWALQDANRPVVAALVAILDIVSVSNSAKEAHGGRGLDILRRNHETRAYVDRLCELDREIDRLEQLAKDLSANTTA